MGLHYDYENLDLISVTTVTNIITFIQFAFIPLEKAKNETISSSNSNSSSPFTSIDVTPIIKVLMSPFDFIDAFFAIAVPMRVLLSAVIIIGVFNLLILSFFFPAWRLILFLTDLFLPGMAFFGTMWLREDYEAQKKVATWLAAIGWIYIIGRILIFAFKYWVDRKDSGWGSRVARHLTSIFLARITKNQDAQTLDEESGNVLNAIRKKDPALNFNDYSMVSKITDIVISIILLVALIVIQYGITWKKIIEKSYSGIQLDHILVITKYIGGAFVISFSIRLLIAIIYSVGSCAQKLVWLRRKAFQGIVILTGLVLIPVVNLVLQSTEITTTTCPYGEYYDFNTTQESFVSYFSDHPSGCIRCSNASYNDARCRKQCTHNNSYETKHSSKAMYISEEDLSATYTFPITILEIYFLFFLIQFLQKLFKNSKTIIEYLPAPTKNTEAKFASIVKKLKSTGGYVFSSYSHSRALFYFDFTQLKTFILFISSLLPVFPIDAVKENASKGITIIFIIACLGIAAINILYSPYRSSLHNFANTVSYGIGFLTSIIALIRVIHIETSSVLGTVAYLFVVIVPIVTTLVIPFCIKFDVRKRPVEYSLKNINKANRLIESEKRNKKNHDEYSDDDSELSSIDPDIVISDFDLLNLAPTHISTGIDLRQKNYEAEVRRVWTKADVAERDLEDATNELFKAADELLDATSYDSMKMILNVSTIVVSACFGWGLGAGVAHWKTESNFLNCMVEDDSFYIQKII